MWAGLLNRGVSVFNGKEWRNYGVLQGPIGERIFDIACSPVDGDVWMATSAGLTSYAVADDSWTSYTRYDGLPQDHCTSLAFARDGTLYVGTACEGLAIGIFEKKGIQWRTVQASESRLPAGADNGLPSGQINDVLVSASGVVFVATSAGLATSADQGRSWTYLRGQDFAKKVEGRLGGKPAGWTAPNQEFMARLLPEDYVKCLAEDSEHRLWIGFRQKGLLVFDPATGGRFQGSPEAIGLSDGYIVALLTMPDGKHLVGGYSTGLRRLAKPLASIPRAAGPRDVPKAPKEKELSRAFPAPARAPSVAELNALLASIPQQPSRTSVLSLEDDWRTQGAWTDSYARFAGALCAMGGGGNDFICGQFAAHFEWKAWIGRNHPQPDDVIRRWVHWKTTTNPRSLQNPFQGGRKQSEWDDHGEAYPLTLDGPHVYSTIKVPRGDFVLSLYFFNKDGHSEMNRIRDYLVEVKPTPLSPDRFSRLGIGGAEEEAFFESQREGARARVQDFWGGVYKRFYISAPSQPTTYTIRVSRNHSFNTILSSIFVDYVGNSCGTRGPVEQPPQPRKPMVAVSELAQPIADADAAALMLDRLLALRDTHPAWYAANRRRFLLPLVRYLFVPNEAGKIPADQIERSQQFAKWTSPARECCGRKPTSQFRKDLGVSLQDLQLFALRDRVYFCTDHYQTFGWKQLTQLGEGWQWDQAGFEQYLLDGQSKQTLDLFNQSRN